ncbi:hypothetical protein DFP72DRAFT_856344 [Ephemerocybe angulata]|uniref:Uncharacterized protein n=1 Tax=Ephemerocybe angulata TaxID=980116 RepID=A0A8H6LXB9_9AGAR|nr:hypothetical protein DFP72DRAFT_856344 [Tulosesus angulatus]
MNKSHPTLFAYIEPDLWALKPSSLPALHALLQCASSDLGKADWCPGCQERIGWGDSPSHTVLSFPALRRFQLESQRYTYEATLGAFDDGTAYHSTTPRLRERSFQSKEEEGTTRSLKCVLSAMTFGGLHSLIGGGLPLPGGSGVLPDDRISRVDQALESQCEKHKLTPEAVLEAPINIPQLVPHPVPVAFRRLAFWPHSNCLSLAEGGVPMLPVEGTLTITPAERVSLGVALPEGRGTWKARSA